jgi:hypothetical protein
MAVTGFFLYKHYFWMDKVFDIRVWHVPAELLTGTWCAHSSDDV